MSTRIRVTGVLLTALAICGCASNATTASSTAAARSCTDSAVSGNTVAHDACVKPGERSYSQADIERTGKTSAGDALALLDPAIVVKH